MAHVNVKLDRAELAYIRRSGFLNLVAKDTYTLERAGSRSDKYLLQIDRGAAEELREAFTDRLATVGFDLDYELTGEGELLEELIDRFFED